MNRDSLEEIYGLPKGRTSFSLTEIAAILVCSDDHIINLIKDGLLETSSDKAKVKIKSQWRVTREAFLNFLKQAQERAKANRLSTQSAKIKPKKKNRRAKQ